MSTEKAIADFWFDPSCPYTWITSRWLVEVAKVRPVEVRWHVMSLSVLNEGLEDDPEGDPEGYMWVPVRICAAVQQEYGQERLGRLYTAMWTHGRERGAGEWLGALHDSLTAAGLPPELAEVGQTSAYDDAVRASHDEGMALIGKAGTPIVAVTAGEERIPFFGPVLSRIPEGEQAGRLWDGTLLVSGTPGFHELKGRPHEEPRLGG